MKSTLARVLALVFTALLFAPSMHAVDRTKSLAPRYRHWVNEEVNYIIQTDERKQFLSLISDAERDRFIEAFWKIRNPDPQSDSNSYRDEHYRRLAYANEHFGRLEDENGWRSDQGRIYIILGPPKQVVTYPLARNVRPIEIWFYQSASLALPPYFNIVFYKRSIGEPFALYSPNQDGPARLVSSLEALNDQKKSLDMLRKSLGDEVATTALTLIPGEAVNLDDYQPSLSSDALLAAIEGLPDNPITMEQLNANRTREQVSTSIFTGEAPPELSYTVFRDEKGAQTVSYLLQFMAADPKIIGTGPDKGLEYDLTLQTSVLTSEGKPVYNQQDQMSAKVSEAQAEVGRKKRFGAEGRLPLEAGKYTVIATLTNNLTKTATRQQASIIVPASKSGVGISPLLAYSSNVAPPDPDGLLPFSVSHLRFAPRGAQSVYLRQGEKLPLVFQLWLDPKLPTSTGKSKVHLRYLFGSDRTSHETPSQEDEEVDAGDRDEAGNLTTGHTVNTSELLPGIYRLVVSANMVGEQRTAYETMTLHVVPSANLDDIWTAHGGVAPGGLAIDNLKRGISAEAQGADAEARIRYADAITEGPSGMRALDRLAALLKRNGSNEELAALSREPLLSTSAANPRTLIAIADALANSGNSKKAVSLLDAQIKLQPPSADLYKALANACEATGDTSRARDLRVLAARVN